MRRVRALRRALAELLREYHREYWNRVEADKWGSIADACAGIAEAAQALHFAARNAHAHSVWQGLRILSRYARTARELRAMDA